MNLLPGDILLFKGSGFISWAVKLFTWCPWTHAGVHVGRNMYVHAVHPGGVRLDSLDEYKGEWRAYEVGEITGQQRWRIAHFCLEHVGADYDFWQLFMLAWKITTHRMRRRIPDINPDKFVCSELVAEALHSAGINLGRHADSVVPRHIMESPLMDFVAARVEVE